MNHKILIAALVLTSTAIAHQDLMRTPFVVASRRGFFYAKVVEADKKATVYEVAATEDIPVYALDWDASEMFLAEVDVGTVAVLCRSWIGPEDAQRNAPVLSFYVNGKIQKEYSLESILGPKVKERFMRSETMERVFAAVPGFMELEQAIPYTYFLEKPRLAFQVQTSFGSSVLFQIESGEIIKAAQPGIQRNAGSRPSSSDSSASETPSSLGPRG